VLRAGAIRSGSLRSLFVAGALSACGLDANGELAPGVDAGPNVGDTAAPSLLDASVVVPPPTLDAAGSPVSDSGPPPRANDGATNAATGTDAGVPFCDAADPSLLLCLRFENEVRDESSHMLLPTSAMLTYAPGVRGQGAVFTPPSDAIFFPNASLWNVASVTVEAWVRPHSLPGPGARTGVLDSDGRFGLFVYAPGTIDCLVQTVHLVGPVLATDQWAYVACTYDGATVTLYVGGKPHASAPLPAAGSSEGTTGIGQNSPSGDPLDGEVDELRVFSVARTAAQIAAAATP
jgi:hypothetical protein